MDAIDSINSKLCDQILELKIENERLKEELGKAYADIQLRDMWIENVSCLNVKLRFQNSPKKIKDI
jgi:hypothetical protein